MIFVQTSKLHSNRFLNLIVVPTLRRAADEVAEEAGEEELRADEHRGQGDVEPRGIGDEALRNVVEQAVEFVGAEPDDGKEADEEHQRAEEAENVHRLLAESAEEPQRDEVEIAVYKTVQSHKLRRAVFPRLMLHDLLANLVEAGIFRQIGNEAVHFAEHLDVFHDISPISLQSAVEIVQVLDAADLPRRRVEEFRGQRFRQRVVAFLLVARHEVVAVLGNHPIEFGNLVGRVLQVGIHRDDDIALRLFEAAVERGTFAVVSAETDATHVWRLAVEFADDFPRAVGRAVVDENDFIRKAFGLHHFLDPLVEFGERIGLVVKGNYD